MIAIPSRILEQKPSRQMPKGIHDPDTPLVFIDRYSPDHATNHDNKLDNPDDYVFMVHYYQPDHPLLYLQVNITNGPTVEEDAVRRGGDQAGVPIGGDVTLQDVQVYLNFFGRNLCHHHYRPGLRSSSATSHLHGKPGMSQRRGQRSRRQGSWALQVGDHHYPHQDHHQDHHPGHYRITEEFDIKFMNNGPDGAWIEYVMAMPATDFTPALLQPDDSVNQADRFVQECGQDHFFLPDTLDKEDFCRASVTSISADFNERALQCECDIDGAINHHQVNI